MGNPNATSIVTIVSSPFCAPCAQAHKQLHFWLDLRDDILVKIVFVFNDQNDEERRGFAEHMISLVLSHSNVSLEKIIDDWYSDMDLEKWTRRYPANKSVELDKMIENQLKWFENANMEFTPTIYINGYEGTTKSGCDCSH